MDRSLLEEIVKITNVAHATAAARLSREGKACKRGCNACCHQITDVFTWEEPKVFEGISKLDRKQKREIGANLKRWFGKFNKHTRDADRTAPLTFAELRQVQQVFREERIKCPFLLNSECSIYEYRPLSCRVHYSESKEDCLSNPHRITPGPGHEAFGEAADMFDPSKFFVAMKPLPYLVALEFNVQVESKPLQGIIYDPNMLYGRI